MNNIFERIDTSDSESQSESESSSNQSSDDNSNELFNERFMNNVEKKEYKENRDNLFTKNIEKFRLLVDSKNIEHSNDHDTSEFKCYLESNTTSTHQTSGFGRFKNIIGFRLVEAIVPSTPYNVNENNNIVYIIFDSVRYFFSLTIGYYDNDSLKTELQNKLNERTTWIRESDNLTNILSDFNRFTVTFNNNNDLKYKTELSGGSSFYYDFKNTDLNSSYNILGFLRNNTDNTSSTTHISDFVPDISTHFLDIVVPEIPYIACKLNQHGKSILARIPILEPPGSTIHYSPSDFDYDHEKFFFPISLDKFTVQLFDHLNNHKYQTKNLNVSLEFEITVVNDISLIK